MNSRVRTLVVTPDFPPDHGGIQRLVDGVVRHSTRIDPLVLTMETNGAPAFDGNYAAAVRRVRVPAGSSAKARAIALNAAALRAGLRRDVRVVLNAHIVTAPAAAALSRLRALPYVQYLHAQEAVRRPRLTSLALTRCAACIAVSRHTASLAVACGMDSRALHVIPPGVDLPPPADALRQADSEDRPRPPVVVTVARLTDRRKGHDVMLEALPEVLREVPDVLWVVIGDGPLRGEYEQAVQDGGLEAHVSFLGELPDAERDRWLDRAVLFAMPSRVPSDGGGEGFGIVYLEAAARGLPVVAANEGGAVDAVVDGETGVLVDPRDAHAIARAIVGLLLDRRRAQRFGASGAARARTFAWPLIAGRVEDLLVDLARSGQ